MKRLVVSSFVKQKIAENGGLNTSARTLDALSSLVEEVCARACDLARRDEMKTVMARHVTEALQSVPKATMVSSDEGEEIEQD